MDWELAILLAAIASATAPASTMMTIRQTGAKGDFVNTILQVVSLDNAIALILLVWRWQLLLVKKVGALTLCNLLKPYSFKPRFNCRWVLNGFTFYIG